MQQRVARPSNRAPARGMLPRGTRRWYARRMHRMASCSSSQDGHRCRSTLCNCWSSCSRGIACRSIWRRTMCTCTTSHLGRSHSGTHDRTIRRRTWYRHIRCTGSWPAGPALAGIPNRQLRLQSPLAPCDQGSFGASRFRRLAVSHFRIVCQTTFSLASNDRLD